MMLAVCLLLIATNFLPGADQRELKTLREVSKVQILLDFGNSRFGGPNIHVQNYTYTSLE